MGRIKILPEAIANKIAAGEVVERPASVVKELLENSLDAGATRIRIEVEAGGKKRIQVEDNGCGMIRDDALLAFERHATSKLRSADDLLSIATLGFRGEALPSIAAVSRLVLETRSREEVAGTRVEIAGGRLLSVQEAGLPEGTSITVSNLFYNTPARRRFLRSESTELSHITSTVTHYSLAHPEKSFLLSGPAGELIHVSPVGSLRERVFQLFGGELLEDLVPFGPRREKILAASKSEEPEDTPAGGTEQDLVTLSGFLSRPQVQKLNRNSIYIFVNRRLIRDHIVLHAIHEAYRNILPSNCFPVALLFLEMPYGEVDVNVHPSKIEVRFRHQTFVHDLVRDTLRECLTATRPVSTFPAGATWAPEPPPVVAPGAAGSTAAVGLSDGFRLSEPQRLPPPPVQQRLPQDLPLRFEMVTQGSEPAALPGPRQGIGNREQGIGDREQTEARDFRFSEQVPVSGESCTDGQHWNTDLRTNPSFAPISSCSELAELRPLGQISDSFIVAASSSGLWLIDQHVAHERILFENFLSQREKGAVESQRLLLPYILRLTGAQQALWAQISSELMSAGFDVEPFGQNTVAVKAAPAGVKADDVEKLLSELVESLENESRSFSTEAVGYKIAASVACHAAIKINTPLERKKMDWLLRELPRTECPMTCPHGRPILLRFSMKEIQKAFKRI